MIFGDSEFLLYTVGMGLINSWRISRMSAGPIVEAGYHRAYISFRSTCYCSCCSIAAHFYVDIFGSCVVCGDFIEDTKAGILGFVIGFICLDKEVVEYEAKSSRFIFTDN